MRIRSIVAALLLSASGCLCQVLVSGAGATFPYPIYSVWFDEYRRSTGAEISYRPIGSGAGVQQLQEGATDFAASDRPLTDRELAELRVKVLHIPTVVGAVVPIYNLPGVQEPLNFTPEALAGILRGTIRKWSDPELAVPNPGIKLPDVEIVAVRRSDASGSTFVLTDFLGRTNPAWKAGPGTTQLLEGGTGARGNQGVAATVLQTVYSFGYVELAYASHNGIAYGRVRNAAGDFIKADFSSVMAAAETAAAQASNDLRFSITNAPGRTAYPIASFTWLLAPSKIEDSGKRKIISGFLRWMLRDGQKMAEPLGYAPLPKPVARKALELVRTAGY